VKDELIGRVIGKYRGEGRNKPHSDSHFYAGSHAHTDPSSDRDTGPGCTNGDPGAHGHPCGPGGNCYAKAHEHTHSN